MQIELLWIIPVVAFAFFILILILLAQKKEAQPHTSLSQEVAQFNTGLQTDAVSPQPVGGGRLIELERSISLVTDSLAGQQRAIERFSQDSSANSGEINQLKKKLRELYKEYDIVLSENYSLRARVKKMQGTEEETGNTQNIDTAGTPRRNSSLLSLPAQSLAKKLDMNLYEDTRLLNLASLDDTSEINLEDLS